MVAPRRPAENSKGKAVDALPLINWLFSNPPEADYNHNDYTGFHKNIPNGISGCKKNVRVMERFLTTTLKHGCAPPIGAGKFKPPALRVVVDSVPTSRLEIKYH